MSLLVIILILCSQLAARPLHSTETALLFTLVDRHPSMRSILMAIYKMPMFIFFILFFILFISSQSNFLLSEDSQEFNIGYVVGAPGHVQDLTRFLKYYSRREGCKRVSKLTIFDKSDVFRGGSAYVLAHNFGLAKF